MAVSESNRAWNSRWLPSSSWVRMNKWSFFLCKMAESKIAEFKMAAIINLSENAWVKFFCANAEFEMAEFKMPAKMALYKMAEFKMPDHQVRMNDFESDWIRLSQSFVQHGWIQDGRIQDGCHHPVNQIELVWVRVRVEGECFWVNLREDDQVSWIQDGSVWIQHGRIQDGCHHQVESEWMSEVFFVQIVGTNLGKCEWVWEEKLRWLNPRWPNSIWLPSSS